MRRLAALAALGALVVGMAPARGEEPADPPFSVPAAALEAALDCPAAFEHPEREPVLLVHGTFTRGDEQYNWNYRDLLDGRGFDVCSITYPDRGLGDMQVSAEYVAYALQEIHARSGSLVDMVGHSQGGLMPRWALKWWPSARAATDDFVMIAAPNHGTAVAERADQSPFPTPEVFWQFDSGSAFIAALNANDETPGEVSYSSIYSLFDELVQPATPEPTAALDLGREDANTRNVLIQDHCPLRAVDHLSSGTTDVAVAALVLDALTQPGPTDPIRAGLTPLCAVPDQYVSANQPGVLLAQMPQSFAGGFPDWHNTSEEPELKPYAR